MSRATLIRREQEGLLEVGRTSPGGQRRYRKHILDLMLRSNGLITLLFWLVALALVVRCVLTSCPVLRHLGLELPSV